ncbi:MAG: hypothetical protein NTW96_12405 [Planctomycetia bacterium]|nr:hypothetical protein [Planctomycetia bacterium]
MAGPGVADLLEGLDYAVHLGHPPVIRALAKHEAKTDRCDSDRLGKFLLRGDQAAATTDGCTPSRRFARPTKAMASQFGGPRPPA